MFILKKKLYGLLASFFRLNKQSCPQNMNAESLTKWANIPSDSGNNALIFMAIILGYFC